MVLWSYGTHLRACGQFSGVYNQNTAGPFCVNPPLPHLLSRNHILLLPHALTPGPRHQAHLAGAWPTMPAHDIAIKQTGNYLHSLLV